MMLLLLPLQGLRSSFGFTLSLAFSFRGSLAATSAVELHVLRGSLVAAVCVLGAVEGLFQAASDSLVRQFVLTAAGASHLDSWIARSGVSITGGVG